MRFQVLSHAGLLVEHAGKTLVCDPWLLGSCYWRSWWNYPPVAPELVASLKPDVVYLTHIHWDHFHGPSLKLFDRNTLIVVPRDHHPRLVDDLAETGFRNVRELGHGETLEIAPDFKLTSYHIMPYLDSAVIVEAGGVVLMDANDAKFMGLPLRQILNRHPTIDFVFRSHSSANNRVCFEFTDGTDMPTDDKQRYERSFAQFAAATGARYAIPFASNHCHLHDDVYGLNSYIQTPATVAAYCNGLFETAGVQTRAVVMLSGDSWSPEAGFDVAENDWFENRDAHLAAYRERVRPSLDKTAREEANVRLSVKRVSAYFLPFIERVPWLLRRRMARRPLDVRAVSGERSTTFRIDVAARAVTEIPREQEGDMVMVIPATILRMSMQRDMFAQAGISKRVRYRVTRETFPLMMLWTNLLNLDEHRLLPWTRYFRPQFLSVYWNRWRELLLVGQLALMMIAGRRPEDIEAKLLTRDSGMKAV